MKKVFVFSFLIILTTQFVLEAFDCNMINRFPPVEESLILFEEDGTPVVIPMSRCETHPKGENNEADQTDSCQRCAYCLLTIVAALGAGPTSDTARSSSGRILPFNQTPLRVGLIVNSTFPARAPPV